MDHGEFSASVRGQLIAVGLWRCWLFIIFVVTFAEFIKLKGLCNIKSINRKLQSHDERFGLSPSISFRESEVGKQREWICDLKSFAVLRTANKATLAKNVLGQLRNGNQCLEIHLCGIITLCKWWEEGWSDAGKGQWDCFGSHLCLDTVMCSRIHP